MNFLSIFSGIEAASVAFEPLGWTCVGLAEIDPFACAVLAYRFGSNLPGEPLSRNAPPNFGDVSEIDLSLVPSPVDLLVGGSPCQGFSFAGKRLSLADARGNLTLTYAVLAHELVRSHGLRNALWENVPGVLSTKDNAFGCFLGALVGADGPVFPDEESRIVFEREVASGIPIDDRTSVKFPNAGMVAGPLARAAWRILDAQYFNLAQRRERVFLVVDFGNGADPAAVLFEPQSMSGNSAPSRETGQGFAADVAGCLTSSGRGVERPGNSRGQDPVIAERSGVAYGGGGNRSGPIDVAATLVAKGQKLDFEVETFIVGDTPSAFNNTGQGWWSRDDIAAGLRDASLGGASHATVIAHTLRGEGFDASEDGTGRGIPLVPIAFTCKDYGGDAQSDLSPTLRAGGFTDSHANAGVMPAIAYAIQAGALRENPDSGPDGVGVQSDHAYTLEARAEVQAVAYPIDMRQASRGDKFTNNRKEGSSGGAPGTGIGDDGDPSPTVAASHVPAVAYDMRGREGGAQFEGPHDTANIRAANGGSSRSYVLQRWAVRRLTPVECARLQGFKDHHARIPWRGKPEEQCPDGPQYKTFGNSMPTKVMKWLAERIDRAIAQRKLAEAAE